MRRLLCWLFGHRDPGTMDGFYAYSYPNDFDRQRPDRTFAMTRIGYTCTRCERTVLA
jgi:hypothetical protein